jgi:hypothetical protein
MYLLASLLAAALLDSLVEHPEVIPASTPYGTFRPYCGHQSSFSASLPEVHTILLIRFDLNHMLERRSSDSPQAFPTEPIRLNDPALAHVHDCYCVPLSLVEAYQAFC